MMLQLSKPLNTNLFHTHTPTYPAKTPTLNPPYHNIHTYLILPLPKSPELNPSYPHPLYPNLNQLHPNLTHPSSTQPLLRSALEVKPNMDEEDAKLVIDYCMKVLYYRDARSWNRVNNILNL